ncbi:cytochrome c5 family protein [Halomonas sp. 328]|nr:cytochrome c5 family protein [Halomonas sp. 328]
MGCLATLGLSAGLAMAAQAQTDSEREAIAERLKPVGELCLQGEECGSAVAAAAPSGNGDAIDGSAIYGNVCMACHETGAANAPVRGNEEAWASRVEQGFATLLDHSINGFNAMPARGGNPNLSDAEVEAATAYLLEPVMEVPAPSSDDVAAEEASADSGLDGETLYGSSGCAACHASGVAGAPVLGDADAWVARLEQGTETLYDHAINGLGAMPPKGGNAGLGDDEVKAIVDYMVAEAQ